MYTDEPILRPASQMKNYLPQEYLEMKKIAVSHDYHDRNNEAAIFYKQALFMQDFTDDCPSEGPTLLYYPTYRKLNDRQLRGYFTWRTNVRKGLYQNASPAYAYLYLYELIHLIGVADKNDAWDRLLEFGEKYLEHNNLMTWNYDTWMTDFYVYYQPDRPFEPIFTDCRLEESLAVLRRFEDHTDDEVFAALCERSSYRLEHSKFVKEHYDDIKTVTVRVYRRLHEHHKARCKHSVFVRFFGAERTTFHNLFGNAVFYEPKPHADCEIAISPMQTFVCRNGSWQRTIGHSCTSANRELGAILKMIDVTMREAYEFPMIKPAECSKLHLGFIRKELALFLEEKKKRERATVHIDLSKLDSIRKTSEITCNKLLVENDTDDDCSMFDAPACDDVKADATAVSAADAAADTPLSPDETAFLRHLLYGGDALAFAREHRLMPSVLVDNINEAFFDTFGDTVLLFDGDVPTLIDDYIDDLKGRILP